MKRGSATKKSGTIAYQLHVRNDLQGKSTKKNPTMAVSIVNSEVITTEQLAKDINRACSITESDVAAVLQAVGQRIGDALLDGNRVEIDHIGTFSLALTCKNKRKEDHITSKDIEVSRIVFSPCAGLQQTMRGAVIVSGGPTGNKQLSDAVIEKRLAEFFITHHCIQRSEFEHVCECSRYAALAKLKAFVKAGKLAVIGKQNTRAYIPVGGAFGQIEI
ncbi:MAG: HU family DNA-binding protein [Bacteroidaceae bacterium]|nr:HU family DNA-binding protein [Bacteroidaceae bacterium]